MIREFKEKDISKINEIILDYLSYNPEYEICKNKILESLENILNNNNRLFYVFTNSEDEAIAYMNLHIIDFPLISGKELYISELFVDSKVRGQNIGSKFIEFAIDKAEKLECKRIMLNNSITSKAYERNFYKKLGFIHRDSMANFILKIT